VVVRHADNAQALGFMRWKSCHGGNRSRSYLPSKWPAGGSQATPRPSRGGCHDGRHPQVASARCICGDDEPGGSFLAFSFWGLAVRRGKGNTTARLSSILAPTARAP
jgi:hypothetical protein